MSIFQLLMNQYQYIIILNYQFHILVIDIHNNIHTLIF